MTEIKTHILKPKHYVNSNSLSLSLSLSLSTIEENYQYHLYTFFHGIGLALGQ